MVNSNPARNGSEEVAVRIRTCTTRSHSKIKVEQQYRYAKFSECTMFKHL